MQLVDSHAHLDFVDDLDNALERTKAAGVGKIITIGTSVESSKRAIEIAEKYSDDPTSSSRTRLRGAGLQIFATCGLHPKDAKTELAKHSIDDLVGQLRSIAESSDKVVAIGECGLDYYLGTRDQGLGISEKDKKFQRELFEAQIKLATDLDLPIVIHCRNGWGEIFDLILKIKDQKSKIRGVFHCWTGDWDAAKKALDLGFFYISFSGIVTFGNAREIQEVAKKAPIDRILVETDSPFLAPDPHRGKTNEPENVKIVVQFVANLRNLPFDKIAEATTRNAESILRIESI